jgi:hypothetical protein
MVWCGDRLPRSGADALCKLHLAQIPRCRQLLAIPSLCGEIWKIIFAQQIRAEIVATGRVKGEGLPF